MTRTHKLGIYEKALPKNLSWPERLALAKACSFDFVEISIDESDERLLRRQDECRDAKRKCQCRDHAGGEGERKGNVRRDAAKGNTESHLCESVNGKG